MVRSLISGALMVMTMNLEFVSINVTKCTNVAILHIIFAGTMCKHFKNLLQKLCKKYRKFSSHCTPGKCT